MKVTYVTMQWPAASETFAARDVNALIDAGEDVSVMALRPDFRDVTDLKKSLSVESVPSLVMGVKNQIRGVCAMILNLGLAARLFFTLLKCEKRVSVLLKSFVLFPADFLFFDRIKKENPDVVHLFWGHYPSMVGWLVQEKFPEIQVTQFLGPYDLLYNYGLSTIVAKRAEAVFTHTRSNVDILRDKGIEENKIHVVHRGIKTTTCDADIKKDRGFIYVGRLIRAKGIFEMLAVFSKIVKSNPEAHLMVVGDGEDRTVFEAKIEKLNLKDNVTMTGWLSPPDVSAHLKQASIMLFFSHSECLPNAIKEAMLNGVVPISSQTRGIDELIENGKDGAIVKDGDDIALIVCDLVNDTEKRNEMSAKARTKIIQNFDVNGAMKKYRDVWLSR
ncbi:MAG: hypothetical protein COB76_01020 [Alphaproteobacteria bacterium]|nr:MAG: hypothetical protein COB76_01020 [Alphaproteobacteria bacterium]